MHHRVRLRSLLEFLMRSVLKPWAISEWCVMSQYLTEALCCSFNNLTIVYCTLNMPEMLPAC
jgi:hypothetical protein